MAKEFETIRFEVEALPELCTQVAVAGAAKQQEVGGAACLGVAAGLAIYIAA
ncbi:hypothetical protein RCO27_03230 [Sphingosinicella sp. LHD-64]|uniref:hypothetical protein n=1 Tax=Sphingosinicella sp. LHD-64 TaxID=3072139 RepID=UPI00280F13EC|nr:hypothetical protein [Sphingosinicella sp. LHD-64]MDQ8755234.1 hypothetical protein [Sphingosinicella sp. LHD-64]